MIIDKLVVYPLVAVIVALAGTVAYQWVTIDGLEDDVAAEIAKLTAEQSRHAITKATYATASAEAVKQNRTIEQQLQAAREETENVRLQERNSNAAVSRAFLRDSDRLRSEIGTYASRGSGSAADASLAASRERAATLGILLDSYVRADGESAAQLESQAADIRALLRYVEAARAAMK